MYNLELDKAIAKIKQSKAKKVCIQLPDGLKPKAKEIQDSIEKSTNAQVFIWAGSCFGSCDIPLEVKNLGVDLLIHWGHTAWK
jgi:2-(3-amino-3-carboxypropyl)histidine synthase